MRHSTEKKYGVYQQHVAFSIHTGVYIQSSNIVYRSRYVSWKDFGTYIQYPEIHINTMWKSKLTICMVYMSKQCVLRMGTMNSLYSYHVYALYYVWLLLLLILQMVTYSHLFLKAMC